MKFRIAVLAAPSLCTQQIEAFREIRRRREVGPRYEICVDATVGEQSVGSAWMLAIRTHGERRIHPTTAAAKATCTKLELLVARSLDRVEHRVSHGPERPHLPLVRAQGRRACIDGDGTSLKTCRDRIHVGQAVEQSVAARIVHAGVTAAGVAVLAVLSDQAFRIL